jgi:hypothetical protein
MPVLNSTQNALETFMQNMFFLLMILDIGASVVFQVWYEIFCLRLLALR